MAVATDDFNRADENPLSGGGNWVAWASFARPKLLTNSVRNATTDTGEYSRQTNVSVGSDQESRIKYVSGGFSATGHFCGVLCRAQGSVGSHSAYMFYVQRDGGPAYNLYLYKFVTGSATQLGTTVYPGGGAPASGDLLRLRTVGSSIVGSVNGVDKISVTDSAVSGGAPGIALQSNTGANIVLDDWVGGDVTGNYAYAASGGITFGGDGITGKVTVYFGSGGVTFGGVTTTSIASGGIWAIADAPPVPMTAGWGR